MFYLSIYHYLLTSTLSLSQCTLYVCGSSVATLSRTVVVQLCRGGKRGGGGGWRGGSGRGAVGWLAGRMGGLGGCLDCGSVRWEWSSGRRVLVAGLAVRHVDGPGRTRTPPKEANLEDQLDLAAELVRAGIEHLGGERHEHLLGEGAAQVEKTLDDLVAVPRARMVPMRDTEGGAGSG